MARTLPSRVNGNSPEAALSDGCKILSAVLEPRGFRFQADGSAKASRGTVAGGVFVNGDRKLEVHFRFSLGGVRYHAGKDSASHEDFMWARLGFEGGNRYPDFGDADPMKAFRDLAYDLETHAEDFLSGDAAELKSRFDHAATRPVPAGLRSLR